MLPKIFGSIVRRWIDGAVPQRSGPLGVVAFATHHGPPADATAGEGQGFQAVLFGGPEWRTGEGDGSAPRTSAG